MSTATSISQRTRTIVNWWTASRLARALKRYGLANGNLLCGGITYRAIFSLFAALTIGFTVLVHVAGNDEELKERVVDAVNQAVPGLIQSPTSPSGLLSIDDLVMGSGLTWTSIAAGLVLLWSVVTAMEALRSSVRAMFSLPPAGKGKLWAKLASLVGFFIVVCAVLASAFAAVVLNAATHFLNQLFDLGSLGNLVTAIATYLVTFVLDLLTFYLIVRVLSGVKAPRRDMLIGGCISAVGFLVIRTLGTTIVVGSAAQNAVFATAAVLVTILVWLYMCARILLTACAVTADPPLVLLERLASEKEAEKRIERAREDGRRERERALSDHSELEVRSPRLSGRFVALAAAITAAWLLGRRTGRRTGRSIARTTERETQ